MGGEEHRRGSFVELRVQMYLAYNRSLHPSLPLLVMMVVRLCYVRACSPLRFIQWAHNPLYALLVSKQMLTRWILPVLSNMQPPFSDGSAGTSENEPRIGAV